MRRRGCIAGLAAAVVLLVPAAAGAVTTTSSSTTSSTSTAPPPSPAPAPAPGPGPAPGGPTPDTIAPAPGNLAQQVSEAPPGEAQLVALLDVARARIQTLTVQLQQLDAQLATNQASLDSANQLLAQRQAAYAAAQARVHTIASAITTIKAEIRQRAVAAYVTQPMGEVANLFLHLHDPAQIDDFRVFYHALVDAQAKALKQFDKLQHDAVTAARDATRARDDAQQQQQSVAAQQLRLTALRQEFQDVQRQSQAQQAQEASLLAEAGNQKDAFLAAVQEQQKLSDAIETLLRQIEASSGPALPASAGEVSFPIPGAPITSPFGPRTDPITGMVGFHPGVDFGATFGTPIEAGADGTVIWAGPDGGYGNCTIIDHGHSLATLYAHQSEILVTVGEQVKRGQVIGSVGSTGYSTGPHLHFEVRVSGTPVDPVPYL